MGQLERVEEEGERTEEEEGEKHGGCKVLQSCSPRGRGWDGGEGNSQGQAGHHHAPHHERGPP